MPQSLAAGNRINTKKAVGYWLWCMGVQVFFFKFFYPAPIMRILLLRHAKSAWNNPGLRDHDRPLARRGERAAPAMGAYFAGTDLRVDRIVSSTAARAWSTACLFQASFDNQIPVTSRHDLYHAGTMDILAIALEEADGDNDARIMLVGHNPGMHDLALFLCGEGERAEVARLQAKFPTGALAELELQGWPQIDVQPRLQPQKGRLLRFVRPKDLPVAKALGL